MDFYKLDLIEEIIKAQLQRDKQFENQYNHAKITNNNTEINILKLIIWQL